LSSGEFFPLSRTRKNGGRPWKNGVARTAQRWKNLADLRAGTASAGLTILPTIIGFRTGCSYRHRLERVLSERMLGEFEWASATRLEFGWIDSACEQSPTQIAAM
jgi:hypothetical protein